MAAFDLSSALSRFEQRVARPSRQAIGDVGVISVESLPEEVIATFLNFDWEKSEVLASDIVAFYAFNYGSARALSFASGLPLTALRRANEMSGWRPKSHSLLRAVIRYREQRPQLVSNALPSTEYAKNGSLGILGILATKTHALLDRGLRRDFFDLYVMLQTHSLGLIDCLRALRTVYATDVNDSLVLRAICYYDDAEVEPAIPGEGAQDWQRIKTFFSDAVSALLVPPAQPLSIQSRVVDVRPR